jgi:hypothetical protein
MGQGSSGAGRGSPDPAHSTTAGLPGAGRRRANRVVYRGARCRRPDGEAGGGVRDPRRAQPRRVVQASGAGPGFSGAGRGYHDTAHCTTAGLREAGPQRANGVVYGDA